MRPLLTRVELLSHSLHLSIKGESLLGAHGSNSAAVEALIRRLEPDDQLRIEPKQMLRLVIAMRPVFRGGRTWLVNPSGAGVVKKPRTDPQLAAGLRNAHAWLAQHSASPGAKPEVLRDASCPDGSYARRIVQLAFLAPDIQKAIIEGRQPPGLTMAEMLARGVPLAWPDQRQKFGFPS
ncbi:MAG TPA: hypothetical protein VL358_08835 [Caulobacteraceae bacterium]|jgi:hypothetical protein|nr:hypothetical protein [Caulobacteraceae bacterium]